MNFARITTPDGTTIIVDPEVGSASGRNYQEAKQEIERRKAFRIVSARPFPGEHTPWTARKAVLL